MENAQALHEAWPWSLQTIDFPAPVGNKNLKLSFSKLEAHMPWRIAPSLKKKNEVTYFVFGYFLPTDYSGTKKKAK